MHSAESSVAALSRVDHLVYTVPDLDAAVEALEERLGIRAAPGGRHEGRGTRNALISLGERTYLEVLGPDPKGPAPERTRWFGVDARAMPRLAGWAAAGKDLQRIVEEAARAGVTLGAVQEGSRRRPDGVVLSWRFTDPTVVVADGLMPFFIHWGDSSHPAASTPPGATLVGLRGEHPDPERVQGMLRAAGVALDVRAGAVPALIATLDTPRGRRELR